jgi:hypothetical protein
VIGDIHLGEQSSVWYGAVLRGDTEPIRVGARTNIQDGCILHADPGYPAIVGEDCVVGHRAVVDRERLPRRNGRNHPERREDRRGLHRRRWGFGA